MATISTSFPRRTMDEHQIARRRRRILTTAAVTLFCLIILSGYLVPVFYGLISSLKTKDQASDANAPIMPMKEITFTYEGEAYPLYEVPLESGTKQLALVKKGRASSKFVDPQNVEAGLIDWQGNWRSLPAVREVSPAWENYPEAFNKIDFPRLLMNTLVYGLVTMFGTVSASAMVAYGFARYRFRFKNILFIVLLGTIILPPQVTLVPTYAFFISIGWGGTWAPMIVPQFFSNAYNVFLLRQYFLTIPREMEEAAMIDGAGPIKTFLRVILPQAVPALTAVALFHFFFAWNDYFGPLIYLSGRRELQPITVGLASFNGLYSAEPQLIMAAAAISTILPLTIFFIAQRVFMQGIVITGVDK